MLVHTLTYLSPLHQGRDGGFSHPPTQTKVCSSLWRAAWRRCPLPLWGIGIPGLRTPAVVPTSDGESSLDTHSSESVNDPLAKTGLPAPPEAVLPNSSVNFRLGLGGLQAKEDYGEPKAFPPAPMPSTCSVPVDLLQRLALGIALPPLSF